MTERQAGRLARFESDEHVVEVWRKPPGYDCLVSSEGRVMGRTRLLRPWLVGGYPRVQVRPDGNSPPRTRWPHVHVHVLVALAFVGPRPTDRHEVAHGDGNGQHNRPNNLRWSTPTGNAEDRDRHGRTARGEAHGCAVLSDADVAAIRARFRRYSKTDGQSAIARDYGVSNTQIWRIVQRGSWKHVA